MLRGYIKPSCKINFTLYLSVFRSTYPIFHVMFFRYATYAPSFLSTSPIKKGIVMSIFGLMLLPFLAQDANATTMIQLSLSQLVDASDEIVRGTVTEVWTEPDLKTGMVWTYAQVEVYSVLKGDPGSVVILEQPGGMWGTKDAIVEGVARFSVGEEGYFFVEHLESGHTVPVGMFQGKFNIVMDPYTQKNIALRVPLHPKRTFDHRFIPLPAKESRVPIQRFELSIQERVAYGWDGQPIPGTSLERLERIDVFNKSLRQKANLERK